MRLKCLRLLGVKSINAIHTRSKKIGQDLCKNASRERFITLIARFSVVGSTYCSNFSRHGASLSFIDRKTVTHFVEKAQSRNICILKKLKISLFSVRRFSSLMVDLLMQHMLTVAKVSQVYIGCSVTACFSL